MATLSEGKRVDDELSPEFHSQEVPYLLSLRMRERHFEVVLRDILQKYGIFLAASYSCSDGKACVDSLSACRTYGDILRVFPPVQTARANEREEIWKLDLEAAVRAFKIGYIVPQKALNHVASQLRKYAKSWNRYQRYAPLVSLVQSSGWGKSRLVCELWREEFFVFYISCMGKERTGFPRRTEHLADIMLDPKSEEHTFVALVSSIVESLSNRPTMSCKDWIQAQQDGSSLQTEVYKNFQANSQKIAKYAMDKEDQYEHFFKPGLQDLEKRGQILLLCVDEAGELGDQFLTLRRSLRCIPKGHGFISVVLGTDRKVADLAAASEDDASARLRLTFPSAVYHPIYLVGKIDVFVQAEACSSSSSSEAGISDIDINIAPKHVIRYGRPLWAAYFDSLEAVNKLDATIQLAKMKLLGNNIDTTKRGWVTRDVAIAVFGCLVGLDVVAWGSLPQKLVAKHMRTIVKISDDRRRVYTAAAVEPALAAAAAELLHENDDEFLGEFLDRLAEVCVDGLVQEGVRGEIVSRIVIMLAMHQCTQSSHYIQLVKMETFFLAMFGSKTVEELKANNANMEANLFFNSLTPTTREISQKLLDEGFARCTAITARRNERVLDMALPARLGPSVRRPQRSSLPRATKKEFVSQPVYHGAALPVQAKNQRDEKSFEKAIDAPQNDTRVNSCAQFFFQIGHRGEPKTEVDHDTVVAYGLASFEHLKSPKMQEANVLSKLLNISRACEDVFKESSAEAKAILQDMIPLGYNDKAFVEDIEEDVGEEVEDDDASIWMTWKEKGSRGSSKRRRE